jgi:hypothetical protein
MTPLDLGLSVVATGSIGIAFYAARLADKAKQILSLFRDTHYAYALEYDRLLCRYKAEAITYRNLLDRKARRNKPQPRDNIGRFTTKAHS